MCFFFFRWLTLRAIGTVGLWTLSSPLPFPLLLVQRTLVAGVIRTAPQKKSTYIYINIHYVPTLSLKSIIKKFFLLLTPLDQSPASSRECHALSLSHVTFTPTRIVKRSPSNGDGGWFFWLESWPQVLFLQVNSLFSVYVYLIFFFCNLKFIWES